MDEFLWFSDQFYQFTGVNLRAYKRPQMERRLTFLRDKLGYHDFRSFLDAVTQSPALLHQLLDRMTINVSEFFRNPERWEVLVSHLADLVQERAKATLHMWSAACSTGEEPYTLAMMLTAHWPQVSFEILATDIDKKVLESATNGRYSESAMKGIPSSYVSAYFDNQSNGWQVKDDLKRHIQFRIHNLLADPYPDSLDLIICRNVLIYFTEDAKQQVVSSLSKALCPGGLLFVGSTEQFMRADQIGLSSVAPFLYQRTR